MNTELPFLSMQLKWLTFFLILSSQPIIKKGRNLNQCWNSPLCFCSVESLFIHFNSFNFSFSMLTLFSLLKLIPTLQGIKEFYNSILLHWLSQFSVGLALAPKFCNLKSVVIHGDSIWCVELGRLLVSWHYKL